MDRRTLSERDICTKFITPALREAGWDEMLQIREEVSFTKGRIIVRGKLVTRGQAKRADYILYYKPNIPIALRTAWPPPIAPGAVSLTPSYTRRWSRPRGHWRPRNDRTAPDQRRASLGQARRDASITIRMIAEQIYPCVEAAE